MNTSEYNKKEHSFLLREGEMTLIKLWRVLFCFIERGKACERASAVLLLRVWEYKRNRKQVLPCLIISLALHVTLGPSLEARKLRNWVWVSPHHGQDNTQEFAESIQLYKLDFSLASFFLAYAPLLLISLITLLWECSLGGRRNTEKKSNSWKTLAGSLTLWTWLCRHLTAYGPWRKTSTESASFLSVVNMKDT